MRSHMNAVHRNEAHGRSAHRLTQRLGVRRFVLAPLNVRLDQLRRDQLYPMPERLQVSCARAARATYRPINRDFCNFLVSTLGPPTFRS
jgi:hypothetical protein